MFEDLSFFNCRRPILALLIFLEMAILILLVVCKQMWGDRSFSIRIDSLFNWKHSDSPWCDICDINHEGCQVQKITSSVPKKGGFEKNTRSSGTRHFENYFINQNAKPSSINYRLANRAATSITSMNNITSITSLSNRSKKDILDTKYTFNCNQLNCFICGSR